MPWRWQDWAESGATRWQGGTLRGLASKFDYLVRLGVTTLWIGPVFKQRAYGNTYHGYAIQDFLDVDPRLGTRGELVDLVRAAHACGLRVLLDIIFNHSGTNWVYPADVPGTLWQPIYRPWPKRYPFGAWLDARNRPTSVIAGPDDGVWPLEFQNPDCYTRAGTGSLDKGDLDDPHAEHKRTDFFSLRDFDLDHPGTLEDLIRCYQYWIALTDCDGFRIDTLRHVPMAAAAQFCSEVKSYAARLGKADFYLVGEVSGGDATQARCLDMLGDRLNAVLDIGPARPALESVAKGLLEPSSYLNRFDAGGDAMAAYRAGGHRHVSIINDHDHVWGDKIRFGVDAGSDHQVAAAVALQYFTPGTPCLYYGMEQNLGGPEPALRRFLAGRWHWKTSDVFLREAMFGPMQPRGPDLAGLTELDAALPGFGPFGTCGRHCFDPTHPAYQRIAELGRVRRLYPVLRSGRLIQREVSVRGAFGLNHGPGNLIAWSRTLGNVDALCIVNSHGRRPRGGKVAVERQYGPPGSRLRVVANTAGMDGGDPPVLAPGDQVVVQENAVGTAYVSIRELPPSETLVLMNDA